MKVLFFSLTISPKTGGVDDEINFVKFSKFFLEKEMQKAEVNMRDPNEMKINLLRFDNRISKKVFGFIVYQRV